MTRIVLDTNVLVSGTYWTGASFKILQLADVGKLTVVLSQDIINEYLRILQSNEILDKATEEQHHAADAATRKLLTSALLVEPAEKINIVKADPDDDKFIEAALAGKAQYIISQDKHLLDLKEYKSIRILTPGEFLTLAKT